MTNSSPSSVAGLPFERLASYQLLQRIGGGGMGSVYLARHLHLNRLVAIKLLAPRCHGSEKAMARFRQEMEAIGRLRHPNIIAATDAGEVNGCQFLVMEYVEGLDLATVLRARSPLAVADACELVRQAAEALGCIEKAGLVHRDVKPSNLLLGKDGVLRVLDLGLARLHEPVEDQQALTRTDEVMGTGDFMAPEQGWSSHYVDIRADVYSLGCTLYALLAGKPPFADPPFDNFLRKVRAHQEAPVPPLGSKRTDPPADLCSLLDRMLAKDPAERMASPAEAAALLARHAAGHDLPRLLAGVMGSASVADETPVGPTVGRSHSTSPREVLPTQPPARRISRRRLLAASLVGLPCLGLLGWFGLGRLNRRAPDSEPTGPDRQAAAGPRQLEPGVWCDLLDRPPLPFGWPDPPGDSFWRVDAPNRKLTALCSGIGMLELAVASEGGFDLEVVLSQVPWVGGIGIFFQGRDEPSDLADKPLAEVLLVGSFDNSAHPGRIKLARGRVDFLRQETSRQFTLAQQDLVKRPDGDSQRLAITVDANGLQRIEWGTAPVGSSLCDRQRKFLRRTGSRGSVGLFLNKSTAVLRAARIRAHTTEG
jgi:serine/threonine protein kinase